MSEARSDPLPILLVSSGFSRISGQHEDRTRVICTLPLRSLAEERAFKAVIAYVRDQQQKGIGIDGYTYSTPGAYSGYWWSTETSNWVQDKIVLLFVDYKISLGDPKAPAIAEEITELKVKIHGFYERYGSPQEEVWVVAHPIMRYIDQPI